MTNGKQVMGYAAPWSVAAGETVEIKVSLQEAGPYRASLLRIICGDDNPAGPGLNLRPVPSAIDGVHQGEHQPIHCGSYVELPACPELDRPTSITISALIWPTSAGNGRHQAILSTWSERKLRGFELALTGQGHLEWRLGFGQTMHRVLSQQPLRVRCWYRVHASYDLGSGRLALSYRCVDIRTGGRTASIGATISGTGLPSGQPLRLGARIDGHAPLCCFDGKIESPAIATTATAESSMLERVERALRGERDTGLLGCWDFALGITGTRIFDVSGRQWHGRSVNLPARAVTGHSWRGAVHDWRHAPEHYRAIHFHADDLYDAAWRTSLSLALPQDLQSGCYAVRLEAAGDASYVTFFVRAPRDRAIAPVAFLASTATYMAYANDRFALDQPLSELQLNVAVVLDDAAVQLQQHPEIGLSVYDQHADGSGVRHSSRLRPVLNHGPCSELWNFNADTHLLAWLEHIGQPVDVITDEDLHREGAALLARYRVVLSGSHPEYCSSLMLQGLADYLDDGGRLMYLGGNGFYWRIAFHTELEGVIEVRRAEGGARYWAEVPGEHYHAFTGELGGLWRRVGTPSEGIVGVSTRAIGFEESAPFKRTAASHDPRVAFMFEGIGAHERIGDQGYVAGGAAGFEIDASCFDRGTPRHALVVAVADDFPASTMPVPEDILMCTPAIAGDVNRDIRAELVFFETGNGGAVFSVGSVAWCTSLPCTGFDNAVARLSANTLRRFLDVTPFPAPAAEHGA